MFTGTADNLAEVTESDETNNAAMHTVIAPDLPDLVVENITYWPADAKVGEPITVSATVWNRGTATTPFFSFRLQREGDSLGTHVGPILPPGCAVTVYAGGPLVTLVSCEDTWVATADYENAVTEWSETNNTAQLVVTGADCEP